MCVPSFNEGLNNIQYSISHEIDNVGTIILVVITIAGWMTKQDILWLFSTNLECLELDYFDYYGNATTVYVIRRFCRLKNRRGSTSSLSDKWVESDIRVYLSSFRMKICRNRYDIEVGAALIVRWPVLREA